MQANGTKPNKVSNHNEDEALHSCGHSRYCAVVTERWVAGRYIIVSHQSVGHNFNGPFVVNPFIVA